MEYSDRLKQFYKQQDKEVKAPTMEQFEKLDMLKSIMEEVAVEKTEFTNEEVKKFFSREMDPIEETGITMYILKVLWDARV